MAENKQYITSAQENGCVMISEDVISSIVSHAVSEVDGVVNISSKPVAELADMIGKKSWGKGMKISISEENEIGVECNVIVSYGCSVVTVAQAVQETVTSAIESMTGTKVNAVNVNVCGIVRQ